MKSQKGFAAVEAILIVAIGAMLGGISWYVISQNQKNKTVDEVSSESSEVPKDFLYSDVVIPPDWKTYQNNKYGFSFKYPADKQFKTSENIFSEEETKNSADKAVFVGGISYADIQDGYSVRVLKTDLETAVSNDALQFNDNTYKDTVKQETIYKNGLRGVRLSYEPEDEKISWFFIQGKNDLVYKFSAVEETGDNKEVSQAMYNSLTIN